MSEPYGVSVVVNNFNGEQFLRAAIDSALAQDHPLVEVIVVDDCSTDGSAAVIESYGDRVRAVLRQENGGQVAAINEAWPLSCHEIVIFLDGDDMLMPHTASALAAVWKTNLSKVQYCLATINASGELQDYVWPEYPPHLDTAAIRQQLLREGNYPSVAACGNAYARSFLQRRGIRSELRWMDQMLEIDAPFFGDVMTIRQPLAYYRFHGQSDSMTTSVGAERFQKLLAMFDAQLAYLAQRCREQHVAFDLDAVKAGNLWHLELRLILCKLGLHKEESLPALLVHTLGALSRSSQSGRKKRFLALWHVALFFAPERLARFILAYRFMPQTRPGFLRAHTSAAKIEGELPRMGTSIV